VFFFVSLKYKIIPCGIADVINEQGHLQALHPDFGAEFDFLFISLLAQRNEPKKEHPGQGLQSA